MIRTGFLIVAIIVGIVPLRGFCHEGQVSGQPGTITVTGSVSDDFVPDTAIVNLAVESVMATARESAQVNATKSEQLVAAMKGLVDTTDGDTVTTSSYSVQPVYEYDEKLKKNKISGYRTFNQVTLKTKKIKSVGLIIDSGLKNGANNVTDIRFTLRDNRQQCDQLLIRAAQRARSEADIVASALGVRLDTVRHASPSCTGEQRPIPVYRSMAVSRSMDSAEPATPVEAGVLTLTGQLQVEFTVIK